jgi:L-rhamnose isomerase
MPNPGRGSAEIERDFGYARSWFDEHEIDVPGALRTLASIPISLHCWQGDDVGGFEGAGEALSGGIAVTGNYPGKARNIAELRADLEIVLKLIPGKHRLNLHASYGDFGGRAVDRDEIEPGDFRSWIDWARANRLGLDFNPTYFSHPKSADGFTLSHQDGGVREFWIEHGRRCREIGAEFGKALGSAAVTNFWIPDGFKDTPADREGPRERLRASLDAVFEKSISEAENLDAVEPKLFGIGSESYVVGSHEFYLGYAISRRKLFCLDAGHFHPTETIADKISSVLPYVPGLLLHVSRGVRWDSDHIVTLTDDLQSIADEIVVNSQRDKIRVGLDFFDATINRLAAWTIGTRSMQKALLRALLRPWKQLREAENAGDFTRRLMLQENAKTAPFGAIWEYFCLRQNVPGDGEWLEVVRGYEVGTLLKRK